MDLYVLLLAIGLGMIVGVVVPAPERSRARRAAQFAKRSGLDLGRRPSADRELVTALDQLVRRSVLSIGFVGTGLGLSGYLLAHGPWLSTSTANSIAVASSAAAGLVLGALLMQRYRAPFGPSSAATKRRPVGVEDYLHPVLRAMLWLAVATACAVPVGAAALASSDAYDGSKIYWEGLVLLPLVAVFLVLLLEFGAGAVRDDAGSAPGLLLWDTMRSRAIKVIGCCCAVAAAMTWGMVDGGLVGVALSEHPAPAWVDGLRAVAVTLRWLTVMLAVVLALPGHRFRRVLWPGLARGERLLVPGR